MYSRNNSESLASYDRTSEPRFAIKYFLMLDISLEQGLFKVKGHENEQLLLMVIEQSEKRSSGSHRVYKLIVYATYPDIQNTGRKTK